METENSIIYSSGVATGSHPEPDYIRSTPPTQYLCQFVLMKFLQRISPTRVRVIHLSVLLFRKMTWCRSNLESEEDPVHHSYIRSYPEYVEAAFSIRTLNAQLNIVTTASWVCRHTGAHKNVRLVHRILESLLQLQLQKVS